MFEVIKKQINLSKVKLAKLWSSTERETHFSIEKCREKAVCHLPLEELDDLVLSYLLPEDLAKVDVVCKQLASHNQKHWRNYLVAFFNMRPDEADKLANPRLTYAEQVKKLPVYFVIGNQRIQRKPFDDPFKFQITPIEDSFPKDKFYLYSKFGQAKAKQKKLIADLPKVSIKYYGTTYPLFKVKLKKPLVKEATQTSYIVDRTQILEFESINQNPKSQWF